MKKVDNKKREANSAKVMLILAMVLLVFAVLCAVYLVLDANDVFDLARLVHRSHHRLLGAFG